jgi:hypothetical protein
MVREDTVIMSGKELRRIHIVRHVMEKKLTQGQAGALLKLTARQIRRLIERVRHEGDRGLVHRGRGRPSNRRFAAGFKAKVLRLYQQQYADFGPTLAAEKLGERQGLVLSDETLRGWLRDTGVTHFRRRKRPHRAWRTRKAHVGELVQLDGSHHDWLEGRGPRCVLLAYIDDASSRVFARFYEYEGTVPALESLKRYVTQYGIPLAVYCDKHTTYRAPSEPTLEEQVAGVKPQSQFERAVGELGIELIHADSPQAKGRVERLFKTLQDRLIKELRLAGIATLDEANRFVDAYLPTYNQRCAVQPAQATDLHRPIPAGRDLDHILCCKTTRVLRRDWTVAHHGRLYQIHDNVRAIHVLVEERLDGTLRMMHHDRRLDYHIIAARPKRAVESPPILKSRTPRKPKADHPWRQRLLTERKLSAAAPMT